MANDIFDPMTYIDTNDDNRFAPALIKNDAFDFVYEEAIAITLRMIYENQKKILYNQEMIWKGINTISPDALMKPDIQKVLENIANGIAFAINDLYR